MAFFHYIACTAGGELREGELEADSPREAARVLRRQMLRVLHVGEAKEKGRGLPFSRVTQKHAAFFCRQLAVMIDTQPIHGILAALEQQGGDKAYCAMIKEVRQSVELGHGLAESLKKYGDAFSTSAVHLIAAGEASGNLPEILGRLADCMEREYEARQKFCSVMLYPLVLAASVAVSFLVMLLFILPSFAGLLEGLHVSLPLPTRILLFLGNLLAEDGHFLLLGGLVLAAVLWQLYRRESVRLRMDAALLRLPVLGKLKKAIAWMHILGTLSVLLGGGLRVDEALSMAGRVTDNRFLQALLLDAKRSVCHGYSMTASLKGSFAFPAMLAQLVAAGESSGRLEEMLQKAADYCRISAENTSRRIQAMMEPVLILAMGGVVILFVLAIVLPMLDSMEAVSGSGKILLRG